MHVITINDVNEKNHLLFGKIKTVEYDVSFNIQVNETMLFSFNKNGPPVYTR